MKKTIVHESRARVKALTAFITMYVSAHDVLAGRCFEVSDVKSDGTVFVRFRSQDGVSSIELGKSLERALSGRGIPFTVPEPGKVRVDLVGFSVVYSSRPV